MTTSIPIGVQTALLQNVVYAMPTVSCVIQTSSALETSLEVGGTFTAFSTATVVGAFIRCTVTAPLVTLRKDTLVP